MTKPKGNKTKSQRKAKAKAKKENFKKGPAKPKNKKGKSKFEPLPTKLEAKQQANFEVAFGKDNFKQTIFKNVPNGSEFLAKETLTKDGASVTEWCKYRKIKEEKHGGLGLSAVGGKQRRFNEYHPVQLVLVPATTSHTESLEPAPV